MKFRLLYHLAFWGSFSLLFVYQNPEANLQDYISWFMILGVFAIVVYTNLYFLLPRYFFKKAYLMYAFCLLIAILSGSLLLHYTLQLVSHSHKEALNASFVQLCINLFSFIVFSSSFKFFREYLREQERLIKIENQQLKTELSLLKSQVNPHFLFNTLNNLYGLILENKNQQAAETMLKLSDLMRYLLESSKTDKVSLKREVQFIQDYLALEKIRLSQQADIIFEVSGLEKDILIPPLLFIPLVENVFKHGLQQLQEGNYAHFSLAVQGNELLFEAQNPIVKSLLNQVKSQTGLNNLRKRLELLYPEKHLLEIENTDDIFKVTLHVNL